MDKDLKERLFNFTVDAAKFLLEIKSTPQGEYLIGESKELKKNIRFNCEQSKMNLFFSFVLFNF